MNISITFFRNRIGFFKGNSLLNPLERDYICLEAIKAYQRDDAESLLSIEDRLIGTIRNTGHETRFLGLRGRIFETDLLIYDNGKEHDSQISYIIDQHLLDFKQE